MVKRERDAQDEGSNRGTSSTTKSTLIESLNALDEESFKVRFLSIITSPSLHHSPDWERNFYFANTLPPTYLQQCFTLIESTSRHDYEPSSFGWHSQRKKREMKEAEMRYILLREKAASKQFGGFMSFMFTHDSTPSVPVLYIYEIHLTDAARGKGLGKHLMRIAEDVAREAGVEKVMLTCFLSNENALAFYKKLGFEVDACSPGDRKTRNKVVKTDYVIMSKDITNKNVPRNAEPTAFMGLLGQFGKRQRPQVSVIDASPANVYRRMDDIDDLVTRGKVLHIRRTLPDRSIQQCMDALAIKRGRVDDAMDWLVAQQANDLQSRDAAAETTSRKASQGGKMLANASTTRQGNRVNAAQSFGSTLTTSHRTPISAEEAEEAKEHREALLQLARSTSDTLGVQNLSPIELRKKLEIFISAFIIQDRSVQDLKAELQEATGAFRETYKDVKALKKKHDKEMKDVVGALEKAKDSMLHQTSSLKQYNEDLIEMREIQKELNAAEEASDAFEAERDEWKAEAERRLAQLTESRQETEELKAEVEELKQSRVTIHNHYHR